MRAGVLLRRAAAVTALFGALAACSTSGGLTTASLTKAVITGFMPTEPVAGSASSNTSQLALLSDAAPDADNAGSAVSAALHRESQDPSKSYRVASAESGEGYDMMGRASWYGSDFHGRSTANGEIFDRSGLSAAHPTLPLPCYVRVTNFENNSSVIVRVNDRGPFAHSRLIDVSEQAAELLAFRRSGSTQVRVQFVSAAPLNADDKAMLLASYRGPRTGRGLAAATPPNGGEATPVAFAEESQGGIAASAMQSLTSAYSPSDRIYMAFDVTAAIPPR